MSLLLPTRDAFRHDVRSHPTSPYAADRCMSGYGPVGLSNRDVDDAFVHARVGIDAPPGDYFSNVIPRMTMPAGSPMGRLPGPSHLMYDHAGPDCQSLGAWGSQESLQEHVRRTNLAAQLANNNIKREDQYAEVQPKLCTDGRCPESFRTAKTLMALRVLDAGTLDRIMTSYLLPIDGRPVSMKVSSVRLAKLLTLLEYLGVHQYVAYERRKPMGYI
ncbi:MAG: hypothetical protein M1814_000672 [Vezdaea aestivalis]|nr:MAG: hypothetical protein M1814_000672 [Vezdaea aestivalis]